MLSIDWPWIWLLLPLPWLLRRYLSAVPVGAALKLPIAAELAHLDEQPAARRAPELILPILAWLALLSAACQPRWLGEPMPLPVTARDLMLAVDVSGSMGEADMRIGGRRVTRLGAVQALAADFIRGREGDRLGLILFGSQAYVYAPLSLDRETVATLLADAEVGLAGKETAIGDAIAIAVKQLRDSPAPERVLILLTDGVSTTGSLQPEKAVELARQIDLRIHTIGFGGSGQGVFGLLGGGAQLDEAQLKQIAQRTGGQYFRARDLSELRQVYAELDRIEPVEVSERSFRPQRSLAHWPLAVFLLLSASMLAYRWRPIGPDH